MCKYHIWSKQYVWLGQVQFVETLEGFCILEFNNLSLLIVDVVCYSHLSGKFSRSIMLVTKKICCMVCLGSSQGMDTNLCHWELMRCGCDH
jgi:hypothetical protein